MKNWGYCHISWWAFEIAERSRSANWKFLTWWVPYFLQRPLRVCWGAALRSLDITERYMEIAERSDVTKKEVHYGVQKCLPSLKDLWEIIGRSNRSLGDLSVLSGRWFTFAIVGRLFWAVNSERRLWQSLWDHGDGWAIVERSYQSCNLVPA